RLLQHPIGIRLAGAGDVFDPAAADREEDEHVQASQPDGVDGQEVAGEDRLAVCAQEAAPRLPVALRRWRQTGRTEDVADGRRRDREVELAQFADDPLVTPARVLAGEPHNQLSDLAADWRSSRTSARVGPAATD